MTDQALQKHEGSEPDLTSHSPGHLWRIGSASLFLIVLVLDFLALDDITTAGAWMPEILFLIASIPALVTAGYYTFRRTPRQERLPPGESERTLEP
jgi:hypothetical protein